MSIVRGEVTAVARQENGWQVRIGDESLSTQSVALCCPAHVNARLLETSAAPVAAELAAIPYSSAILVMQVYERAKLGHPLNGFEGFLVPDIEERKTVAATNLGEYQVAIRR